MITKLLIPIFFLVASVTHGALLIEFPNMGGGLSSYTATSVATGLSVSPMTPGPGYNGIGGNAGTFGFSQSATLVNDEYITFTVTPDAGSVVTIDEVSFFLNLNEASRGMDQYALYSSQGGFAPGGTPIGTGSGFDTTETISFAPITVDATGTEFRLYSWGSTGTGNSFTGYSNFQVSGTVVPEPATLAFLGTAFTLIFCFWRQRRMIR